MGRELDAIEFVMASRGPQCALAVAGIDNPQVFAAFGIERETLACVDDVTGSVLWPHRINGVIAPVTWDAARVYVGASDGVVRALHRHTGELLWQTALVAAMCAPCCAGEALLVGSADGTLTELEARTGIVLKQASVGRSLPIPQSGLGKFWLSIHEGAIVCLDGTTLRPRWRKPFEAPLASFAMGVPDSLAAHLANGVIHIFDEHTGAWKLRLEGCDPRVRPTMGRYVYCVVENSVRAYDTVGDVVMDFKLSNVRSLTMTDRGGLLLVIDASRHLYTVDPDDKTLRTGLAMEGEPIGRIRSEGLSLYGVRMGGTKSAAGPGAPPLAREGIWLHALTDGAQTLRWSTRLA